MHVHDQQDVGLETSRPRKGLPSVKASKWIRPSTVSAEGGEGDIQGEEPPGIEPFDEARLQLLGEAGPLLARELSLPESRLVEGNLERHGGPPDLRRTVGRVAHGDGRWARASVKEPERCEQQAEVPHGRMLRRMREPVKASAVPLGHCDMIKLW